jgi:micrococcal nuclease
MAGKKKLFAGLAVGAAMLGSAGWWTISHRNQPLLFPAYRMAEVIDGDTFVTTEKQHIRLVSIQAPELGRCYSTESARLLTNLLTGKQLYIKVVLTDSYRRLVSLVYTDQGLVNKLLVEKGAAYFANGYDYAGLNAAMARARVQKLGIFSPDCVPAVNTAHPGCVIKANLDISHSQIKTYRFPGCGQYNNNLVQLSEGDQWFCTEKEAQKAGFTKAGDCYNQSWK